jgi:hypothetical protein
LARRDIDKAYQAVQLLSPKPYRRLERVQDVALVGIVGKGLLRRKGIAAQCFTAVAERNVNVEMISFGPSEVAVYFLVRNKDLQKAVEAIHTTFFSDKRVRKPQSPPEPCCRREILFRRLSRIQASEDPSELLANLERQAARLR